MKLVTQTKSLSQALTTAGLAIPTAKTLPALTCALVEVTPSSVRVTCDSMDSRVSVEFDDHECDESFSFLAAPRLLKSAMRGDEATIVLKENRLEIESWGKTKLSVMSVDQFPKEWEEITVRPVEGLPGALSACLVCADPKPDAPGFCLRYHPEDKRLFAGRHNGFMWWPIDLQTPEPFLLPCSEVGMIVAALKGGDEVSFGHDGGAIRVTSGNVNVWVRLYTGQVANFKSLIPQEKPFATLNRESLVNALQALLDFSDDLQTITISPDWVLRTGVDGNESSIELSDVEDSTLDRQMVFSASAILRILKHWSCDKINLAGTNTIGLFPCDDSGKIGILPLRRA